MATYKVIQDIEAEDKLVGPLTLRQFIYAGVSAVALYICFLAYTRNATFLLGFFLPIAFVSGFFAFPWRGEQPTEIWALARLRFMVKPRVRIWDQDGVKDLVSITAPKKIGDQRPVRNLTQNEVRSRLKALADTIDSRGWATRNAAYGLPNQQWAHPTVVPVPAGGLSVSVPDDDMFDERNSVAQNFDAMLAKSTEQKRQRVMQQMSQAQNPQPAAAMPGGQGQGYGYGAAVLPPAPGYFQSPAPNYQPTLAPQLPAPIMPAAYGATPAYNPNAPVAGPIPGYGMVPPAAPVQPQAANYWFANGPAYPTEPMAAPVPAVTAPAASAGRIESDMPLPSAAAPTSEEAAIAESIREQKRAAMSINYGHMRVLQPVSGDAGQSAAGQAGAIDYPMPRDDTVDVAQAQTYAQGSQGQAGNTGLAPVTREPDPAILEFANNDDLDIATIARQAKKEIQKSPDEVEIRLH